MSAHPPTLLQDRQQELLRAVATCAVALLRAPDPGPVLAEVLRVAGTAAGANRAHIFAFANADPTQFVPAELVRWEAAGFVTPHPVRAIERAYVGSPEMGDWMSSLADGQVMSGRVGDMSGPVAVFLAQRGVRAILGVPIFVNASAWGMVALDNCETDCAWAQGEVDAIKTLAELLAASLAKKEHLDALADAHRIIESSSVILFRVGPTASLPLLYISDNIRRYGEDPAALLRSPMTWATALNFEPDDIAKLQMFMRVLLEGERDETRFEYRTRDHDGSIRLFTAVAKCVFDGGHKLIALEGVAVEITERLQAEATHARLAAIIDSSVDAIIGESSTGIITSWNRSAELMYGYAAHEVIGKNIRLLIPPERGFEIERNFATLTRDHCIPAFDTMRLRKDGTRIPVSNSVSSILDLAGNIVGASLISRDITERISTAHALAYRDILLHAVTTGTTALVNAASAEAALPEALRIVGESLQVDRVLVLQECPDQQPGLVLRYAWQAADIGVRIDTASFAAMPISDADMSAWRAPLHAREHVIAQYATSEPPLRKLFDALQNKSVLLMPIFVRDRLWGNLGVDSCTIVRDWATSEIDTLRTFAEVVGGAIMRHAAQTALQHSEERFRVLINTAQDAIITLDGSGMIQSWNHSAERILGYTAQEAMGKPIHELLASTQYHAAANKAMQTFLVTGIGQEIGCATERKAFRKDGKEIDVELSVAGARVGGKWEAIGILRDVTERVLAQQQIRAMARNDGLTGLANRATFVDAIRQAIARAQRTASGFAILYLDLDHFKDVNDTLGHPVGDALLRGVAQRFEANVRGIDTISRFGGDEFAMIAADIKEPADAATIAQKILNAMTVPFAIDGNEIRCATSIGIAIFGSDALDAETLLSHADIALYRAKSEGRNAYRFFTEMMDLEVRTRVTLGAELRVAIDAEQLFLLYQPQVDIETRKLIGVEALVRWRHPTRGVLGPDAFIPIAEHSGLIVALGHWVIYEACRQTRAWLDAGVDPLLVAVNLSGVQFKAPLELERDIAAILEQTGVDARYIELELTESVLMDASRERNDVLMRMRQSGLRLAIDDFGTGYSSLGYLRKFPVDRIKIAQSFILDLAVVPGNKAIVQATIGLAEALNLKVIAEGVETEAQLALLKAWGCREVQGFYFARPLSPERIVTLLRGDQAWPQTELSMAK